MSDPSWSGGAPPSGRAALALAALLFALALPWPAPPPAPCEHPRALAWPNPERGPAEGADTAADLRSAPTRAVACGPRPGGPPLRGPARLLFALPVDPNRADPATLELLPGIGPARAAAIVRERARAPFEHPESLLRVHGIGPATLERMRPWITTPSGSLPRPERGAAAAAALQGNR